MNKDLILGKFEESLSEFFYYDRKYDEELSIEDLDNAIKKEIITKEDLIKVLEKVYNEILH